MLQPCHKYPKLIGQRVGTHNYAHVHTPWQAGLYGVAKLVSDCLGVYNTALTPRVICHLISPSYVAGSSLRDVKFMFLSFSLSLSLSLFLIHRI